MITTGGLKTGTYGTGKWRACALQGGGSRNSPECFFTCWLILLQDPSIKSMAEQIAQDPAFAQMTKTLQESMAGLVNPPAEGTPEAAMAGSAPSGQGAPDPSFDPTKYMDAMTNVLQNPQFMQMAEKLGQQIMQVTMQRCFWRFSMQLTGSPIQMSKFALKNSGHGLLMSLWMFSLLCSKTP